MGDYYQKLLKYFEHYLSYFPDDLNLLSLSKYERDNYHQYNMHIDELKTLIEVEKIKLKYNIPKSFEEPRRPENKKPAHRANYYKKLINYYEKLITRCDIILSKSNLFEIFIFEMTDDFKINSELIKKKIL